MSTNFYEFPRTPSVNETGFNNTKGFQHPHVPDIRHLAQAWGNSGASLSWHSCEVLHSWEDNLPLDLRLLEARC